MTVNWDQLVSAVEHKHVHEAHFLATLLQDESASENRPVRMTAHLSFYYFNSEDPAGYLTQREAECVSGLLQGLRYKDSHN